MSKSIRQQFADTMLDVGQNDPALIVMVGDISHGIMQPFAKACPDRYYNIGILEPTMISIGAGMAATGLRPVLHTIAPFLIERSFEQIKLDFCYHRLAGNIISVGGAFDYSNLGCSHHCYDDFGMLKTLPGLRICMPSSAVEFDQLFRQSYADDQVNYFRLCGNDHGVKFSLQDIVFGKGVKVADGGDATLIAVGSQLRTAMQAREQLAAKGVAADVIYLHTVRPLDVAMIRSSATKTRNVVVIEEHMQSGGVGDDILRAIYDVQGLRFHSVAVPDAFVTGYGSYEELCESCGLTPASVVNAVTGDHIAA